MKLKRFFILLAFPSILAVGIDFLEIKGLNSVIKPEYPSISPLHGYTWWKTGYVRNLYQFGNPDHHLVKLARELFYLQPDDVTFGPTVLEKKPAKRITPQLIGQIVAELHKYEDKRLSGEDAHALKKQLAAKIEDGIGFQGLLDKAGIEVARLVKLLEPYKKKLDAADDAIKRTNKAKNKLSFKIKRAKAADERAELEGMLADFEAKTQGYKAEKEAIESDPIYKKLSTLRRQVDVNPRAVAEIAGVLVDALVENNSPDSHYPPYAVFQLLTAFLWTKVHAKKDFIAYFSNVQGLLKDTSFLAPGVAQRAWLAAAFTRQDFEQAKAQLQNFSPDQRAEYFLDDYERSVFIAYAYRLYDVTLPPIFQSIESVYSYGQQENQSIKFPNCVEVALRNFVNIRLKPQGADALDGSILQQLGGGSNTYPLIISPTLMKYYQSSEFTTLSKLDLQAAHDAWNEVVAQLPGVNYLRPSEDKGIAEINAGFDNAFKVLNHLFFGNNPKLDELPREERLNVLLKALSVPGYELKWHLVEEESSSGSEDGDDEEESEIEKDSGFAIDFSINGKRLFRLKIEENHMVLSSLEAPAYEDYATELAQQLRAGVPLDALNLMAWFVTPITFKETLHKLKAKRNRQFVMLSLPLAHKEQRVEVIKELMASETLLNKNPELIDFVEQLFKSFWKLEDPAYALDVAKFIVKKRISRFNNLALTWAKKVLPKKNAIHLLYFSRIALKYKNPEIIDGLLPLMKKIDQHEIDGAIISPIYVLLTWLPYPFLLDELSETIERLLQMVDLDSVYRVVEDAILDNDLKGFNNIIKVVERLDSDKQAALRNTLPAKLRKWRNNNPDLSPEFKQRIHEYLKILRAGPVR